MAAPVGMFVDMRSVSFSQEQGAALDKQARIEERKVGNLIRRAVCQYLVSVGALPDVPVVESDEAFLDADVAND